MMSARTPESRSDDVDTVPQPGRPIELVPMPRGMWSLLLGAGLALLGPLFGFLAGSMQGVGDSTDGLSPLQMSLFTGFGVGALGVLIALLGVRRLYVDHQAKKGS